MLDIKFIREHRDLVKQNCEKRRVNVDIDELLVLYDKRLHALQTIEQLKAEMNKKVGHGKPSDEERAEMKKIREQVTVLQNDIRDTEEDFKRRLYAVPNMTHPDSPVGDEDEYAVIYANKEPPQFSFPPKDHETILMERDLIDFERATKVAGAKFYFTKNKLVRLNQALISYGLDILEKRGYTLVETPDMAKQEILLGAGFNPRGDEKQIYNIEETELSLIGTAEITMLGYHANEVIDLQHGPVKYAALSHCFRTEAGAYGRTSKGLYRVHQFTKLEMFIFCKPEDSERMHEELLSIEKEICDGLEIPYRVIDIPTGDLGGPAYRKYDIEAWMTMKADETLQGGYGEITSTSNCTDYQARRSNIKYKADSGKNEYVHTLNGTAVVLSRFPIAIIENHQQEDGTIRIPNALQRYLGADAI